MYIFVFIIQSVCGARSMERGVIRDYGAVLKDYFCQRLLLSKTTVVKDYCCQKLLLLKTTVVKNYCVVAR